jgi:hypothetical protein
MRRRCVASRKVRAFKKWPTRVKAMNTCCPKGIIAGCYGACTGIGSIRNETAASTSSAKSITLTRDVPFGMGAAMAPIIRNVRAMRYAAVWSIRDKRCCTRRIDQLARFRHRNEHKQKQQSGYAPRRKPNAPIASKIWLSPRTGLNGNRQRCRPKSHSADNV